MPTDAVIIDSLAIDPQDALAELTGHSRTAFGHPGKFEYASSG